MVIYLGDTPIAGVVKPVEPTRNVGQIIQSLVPLTDAGLHLLDGALIDGSGIYSDFVTYMAGLVSTYPNLFVTEATWQSSVTTYGVCGKFVCTPNFYAWDDGNGGSYYTISDTPEVGDHVYGSTSIEDIEVLEVLSVGTNTIEIGLSGLSGETYTRASASDSYGSVRLPKITGIIEGTTDLTALGDLVEAGLPNITGQFASWRGVNVLDIGVACGTASGAFWRTTGTQSYAIYDTNATSNGTGALNFDASRSSSIYGNSTTVQPQTIKAFIYIVIATNTKTEIEVDIDEIATDLNGKADTDLSNITTVNTQITTTAKNPIINKLTGADITVAPSSEIASSILARDINNNDLGGIVYQRFSNGTQTTAISATNKISGTKKSAYFNVYVGPNGNDAADASAGVKTMIARWAFPSNTSNTLTVGASGATYQAPADGWFTYSTTNTATQNHYIYLNNETAHLMSYSMGNAGVVVNGFIPVKKGDTVSLGYFSSTIASFRFVYAQGAV